MLVDDFDSDAAADDDFVIGEAGGDSMSSISGLVMVEIPGTLEMAELVDDLETMVLCDNS